MKTIEHVNNIAIINLCKVYDVERLKELFLFDGRIYRIWKCSGCNILCIARAKNNHRKYCSHECYAKHNTGKHNGFYGKRHSVSFKKMLSNLRKGKSSWNKGVHQWKNKKHPRGMLNKQHSVETINKIKNTFQNNPVLLENARIAMQKRLIKNGNTMIGQNEPQILDEIELSNSITIIRQFKISGYFLDGYCKKYNIAFEIDDYGHKCYKKKIFDRIRENDVKKVLHCNFVRIEDDF